MCFCLLLLVLHTHTHLSIETICVRLSPARCVLFSSFFRHFCWCISKCRLFLSLSLSSCTFCVLGSGCATPQTFLFALSVHWVAINLTERFKMFNPFFTRWLLDGLKMNLNVLSPITCYTNVNDVNVTWFDVRRGRRKKRNKINLEKYSTVAFSADMLTQEHIHSVTLSLIFFLLLSFFHTWCKSLTFVMKDTWNYWAPKIQRDKLYLVSRERETRRASCFLSHSARCEKCWGKREKNATLWQWVSNQLLSCNCSHCCRFVTAAQWMWHREREREWVREWVSLWRWSSPLSWLESMCTVSGPHVDSARFRVSRATFYRWFSVGCKLNCFTSITMNGETIYLERARERVNSSESDPHAWVPADNLHVARWIMLWREEA